MRKVILTLPFFLSGCAGLTEALAPPFQPEPIRVYDQAQYTADVSECLAAGKAYHPKFHVGAVVAGAVNGATSNTSLIPINPLVPAAGAAGGALNAAADGLDVMSGQHANVARNCLRDELHHDHAAVVADPRN